MRQTIVILLVLLLSTACHHPSMEWANEEAEKHLWTRPDSAVVYLQTARTQGASKDDKQVHQLLLQAALMRLTHTCTVDEWEESLAYFRTTDNRPRIGQCLYYKGVAFALQQQADSSRFYLEHVLDYQDVLSPIYIGMAQYRLAVLHEENLHYTDAWAWYTDALPFLMQTGDSMLIGCCYRDMARMCYAMRKDSLSNSYFAQAEQYAQADRLTILSLDIAIQATGNAMVVDSAQLLRLYQALGREGGKRHYVEKSADMTILQEHLMQEKSLRNQRMWGIWILLILMLSCALALVLFYMRRQREQYRLRLSQLEQDKLRMNIETKRQVLKTRLLERISTADDSANWEAFYSEFDAAFDGLLTRLITKYPDLTEIDKRYITLTCLQLDTADICQILNLTKRTIYNRRQILKQRLGLTAEDLDSWFTSQGIGD